MTNPTFRRLIGSNSGVGIVCTEFVRIAGEAVSRRHLAKQVEKFGGVPLSVQVMGTDVELMGEAAGLIAELGADVVDVNLGCPAPRVVRKGAGSAMLKDLRLLREVLDSMRAQVPGVMSAKIRAGFDDADGVFEIAETVQSAGVDFLVVHPRRRSDFYQGVADWRIIRALKQRLKIPVVGNGDCWYAADALRMRAETGCDAVMIGRPAVRNPWIFRQIAELDSGIAPFEPSGTDLADWIAELVESYQDTYAGQNSRGPLGKVKEVLSYLARTIDDQAAFRNEILRLDTLSGIVRVSRERLAGLDRDQLDLSAASTRRLERSGGV